MPHEKANPRYHAPSSLEAPFALPAVDENKYGMKRKRRKRRKMMARTNKHVRQPRGPNEFPPEPLRWWPLTVVGLT